MSDNKKAKIAMEEEQRTTTGGVASRAVLVQELQDENIALRALLEQYQLRDSWQRQEDEAVAAAIAASIAITPENTPPSPPAPVLEEEKEGWTTTNTTTNPARRSSCPVSYSSLPNQQHIVHSTFHRRSSNVSRHQQAKTSDSDNDDDCDLLDIVRARADGSSVGGGESSSDEASDMVTPKGEWRVPAGPQASYYEGRPGAYPVPGPAAGLVVNNGGDQASNSSEEDDIRRGNHDNNDLDIMKLVELRARGEEALAEVCDDDEEEAPVAAADRLCLFKDDGSSKSTETSSTTTNNDDDSSSLFVVQQDIANLTTTARVKTTTGRKFARTKLLFSKIFKIKPKKENTNKHQQPPNNFLKHDHTTQLASR